MIWSIQIFGDHKNELHEEKHDSLLICWTICKKSIKPQTIEICWKQLHLHWLTVHKNIFIAIKNDNQNPDQRRSTNNNSHSVVAELSYRTESGQRPRCRLKKKKTKLFTSTVVKHLLPIHRFVVAFERLSWPQSALTDFDLNIFILPATSLRVSPHWLPQK